MEHLEQILQLAKKLIAVPSLTGNLDKTVEILELVKTQLSEHTPQVFVSNHIPSLLYTSQTKKTKKFKILFNAHLDVVPGTKNDYIPVEKDGKLYGRGAFDMKAAAAVMILLFKDIADKVAYPLGLQLTTDEEVGGHNGTRYQVGQGVRADLAIMGESNSNFQITNQAKGRSLIKITHIGNAAHAAYPWQGNNAIWKMYQILAPIINAFPIPEEETHDTTVSITHIATENDAYNKIPNNCTAYLDVRYSSKDADTIISKIRSLLPNDIIFEADHKKFPRFTNPENTSLKKLRDITTEIRGKKLPFRSTHGTSDAIFFAEVGCQAIEFGPVGKNPHSDNEWVDIQSLGQYYEILKKFLLSL